MTEIQGKPILVRVSEGSSYRESTVLSIRVFSYEGHNCVSVSPPMNTITLRPMVNYIELQKHNFQPTLLVISLAIFFLNVAMVRPK